MSDKTIKTLGADFNSRHGAIISLARKNGVAWCGGCAAAISRGKTDYTPKDIDLVTHEMAALDFISAVNKLLLGYRVHFRIFANSRNEYVPARATAHFRIQTPFWLPICLFIIPQDAFRFYRIRGGHMIQLYSDIREAAEILESIDEKPRMASEEPESPIDESSEQEDSPDDSEEEFDIQTTIIHHVDDQTEQLTPIPIGSGAKQL